MVALRFVKSEGRLLTHGRTALALSLEPELLSRDLLSLAWQRFDRQLEEHVSQGLIAA